MVCCRKWEHKEYHPHKTTFSFFRLRWIKTMKTQIKETKKGIYMYTNYQVTYIFITQGLQQEEEDGFEMFVPHSHAVFPCDLQQLHQGAFTLLWALVVIGQLLQKIGHQVWVILPDCLTRGDRKKELRIELNCHGLIIIHQPFFVFKRHLMSFFFF